MRKFIRSLAISLFKFVVLRITSGTSPSLCTTTGKFIRSLAISSFGILLLRIKGRGVSVPMYLDEENYTQPRDFPHRNSHSAYKEKGRLRPYVPRQGNLYAALRFPSFRILILRIKGRGISVPMHLDEEIYTQPAISPHRNSPIAYKGKGHLRPHAPR